MRKERTDFATKITDWIGSTSSIIVHTIFFIGIFFLRLMQVPTDDILLILTTAVSLEAIYLAIFIQRSINQNSQDLEDVSEDIEEIQKDVEEISEDVEEIQKDVDEISEDVDEIQKDVEEISEEDEEEEREEQEEERLEKEKFDKIERTLEALLAEINKLKK
jgi:uncharacterized membrane protein